MNQLSEQDLLLLVDDGSSDDTLSRLEKYSAINIKVVSYKNRGFVSAIKKGIDSVDSEFVAVHGAGDLSLDGRFEQQVQLLKRKPDLGLVGTWYEDFDVITNKTSTIGKKLPSNHIAVMGQYNPFGHSTVMFRRNVYEKVGGYRNFFKFAQDRDLWCRLSRHCDFEIIEKALVRRYKSVSGSVSADFKKSLHQRYLSDFAIYMHINGYNENTNLSIDEASLYYRPSRELMKDLFKRSVRAIAEDKPKVVSYYQRHVLQGFGLIFYPFYFLNNLSPKLTKRISKVIIKNQG